MDAREIKIQPLIDGAKQFLLPLFQRKYVWDKVQWGALWQDIYQLYEEDEMKTHFIGSIVTIPMSSVPHGVDKFILIDGQQRLTTFFILLCVLRDKARANSNEKLADKINDLITNRHETDNDYYKLLPTEKENDRKSFIHLVSGEEVTFDNQIKKGYAFFDREMRKHNVDIPKILAVITQKLSLVSIVLQEDDNPHLVFESLNSTGIRLLPSDLIRNYFFMRIHSTKQTEMYSKYWQPMENMLGDKSLTEFIRHYLKKEGAVVKETDVYFKLREKVSAENAVNELQILSKYAHYYYKLLNPSAEEDLKVRKYLERLNVLEVTTAYPFLLNCYHDYSEKRLTSDKFVNVLKTLENFLIRRYVANIGTNQLDKIFPPLYKQSIAKNEIDFIAGLKTVLATKNYPTDIQFRKAVESAKIYGGGDKIKKTKHLLMLIEESFGHKEFIGTESLTIEHILPQTLSTDWKRDLGDDWEETHDLYLHTLGNLTLTAYNSELSNEIFSEKKKILANSHLELNKYFGDKEHWRQTEIKDRADFLTNQCLQIWAYFGEENTNDTTEVTGTKPQILIIWGHEYPVKYWADVLEQTVKVITDLAPEKLELLVKEYPRFVNKNTRGLGSSARVIEIGNGVYINKNYSSESIRKFCTQAIQTIELSADDWQVKLI